MRSTRSSAGSCPRQSRGRRQPRSSPTPSPPRSTRSSPMERSGCGELHPDRGTPSRGGDRDSRGPPAETAAEGADVLPLRRAVAARVHRPDRLSAGLRVLAQPDRLRRPVAKAPLRGLRNLGGDLPRPADVELARKTGLFALVTVPL